MKRPPQRAGRQPSGRSRKAAAPSSAKPSAEPGAKPGGKPGADAADRLGKKSASLRRWAGRGDTGARIGLVALIVATPLIPSESAVRQGTAAVFVMLWFLLLAAWFAGRLVAGDRSWRGGRTMLALGVFLALHALSGVVAMRDANARYALNAVWVWLSFGALFFLTRQLIVTPAAVRAMVAVLLGLAVTLSAHGFYQYFVELPRNRAAYEQDPEGTIRQTGIDAPPGSPARRQIVDRIYSLEPMATFALTNSLAGFLAPLLLLGAGVALANRRRLWSERRFAAGCLLILLSVSACLLLTKSRTAILAVAAGGLLLVAWTARRCEGPRPVGVPLMVAAALLTVLLLIGAIAVGGLDLQVLSEAPKSILYRLEYWQATARMILREPWFGCGPGNFQAAYTAFKLPQASESITDPHNFLLEIWATAGTPALLAFLAVGGAFLLQLRAGLVDHGPEPAGPEPAGPKPNSPKRVSKDAPVGREVGSIYAGAAAGILLAYVVGGIVGFPVHVIVLPLALTAGSATIGLLGGWTREGRLPLAPLLCGLAALGINLLAAGGIGFPGVADNAWLLAALSLNLLPEAHPRQLSGGRVLALGLGIAVLVGLCFLTLYTPVLQSQAKQVHGRRLATEGRPDAAADAYRQAAAADPCDSTPWLFLAQLYHQMYLRGGRDPAWEQFEVAAREARQRDPRSSSLMTRLGNLYLEAYEQSGRPAQLQSALEAFERAATLYPNGAMERARWAWTLQRAGQTERARREAEEALRLDQLNPHAERKLGERAFPADRSRAVGGQPVTVEQRMRQLRNGTGSVR